MKKLLTFIIAGVFLYSTFGVLAVDVSLLRSTTGAATSSVSTLNSFSGPNSLRLNAQDLDDPNEARLRVTFNEVVTLADIVNISWNQFVEEGYLSHVDVILDLDADGNSDDALVFEYAKLDPNPANCDDAPYPVGSMNTFDDKGIVDDSAYAWLSSGPAGGCASLPTDFFWHSLSDWKAGPPADKAGGKSISSTTRVLALEIEVDGWIEASESFIDDVMLNGELVTNFDGVQAVTGMINTNVQVTILPSVLGFGSLNPGSTNHPASNGPITFDATGSNVNVRVEVDDVAGFPFEDGLKFDGSDPIGENWDLICSVSDSVCAFTSASTVPTLDVPVGAIPGAQSGTIVYTITGPTP